MTFGIVHNHHDVALALYFDYSMSEGVRMGHLVVWPDPSDGAAVWLLPADTSVYDAEAFHAEPVTGATYTIMRRNPKR